MGTKRANQRLDSRQMAVRPIRLRQHVVHHVHPAHFEQLQRLVEMGVLAWPGVGENEIVLIALAEEFAQRVRAIRDDERDSGITAQVTAGDGYDGFIVVDGKESRFSVHAIQQPGGCYTRTGAELEERPLRFACSKSA